MRGAERAPTPPPGGARADERMVAADPPEGEAAMERLGWEAAAPAPGSPRVPSDDVDGAAPEDGEDGDGDVLFV